MAEQATNSSLKTTDHSRYGDAGILTNPYYDKANGWAVMQTEGHLTLPFTDNWFKPSVSLICSFTHKLAAFVTDGAITASDNTFTSATAGFIAGDVGKAVIVEGAGTAGANLETTIASRTSATEVELTDAAVTTVSGATTTFDVPTWDQDVQPQMESGLWDNTAGQRKWLEGQPLPLSGETKGSPASTISREYFVQVTNDWGETIATQEVAVANAPTDGEFSVSNYVLLTYSSVVGATEYAIYRKTAGTTHLLQRIPNTSYQDRGSTLKTVSDFPDSDYSYTRAHRLIDLSPTTSWNAAIFAIVVPFDYDKSKTTDQQWFRLGLTGQLQGAGLKLYVDRISLDTKRGFYAPCPLDFLAKRNQSSAPTSSDQGNTGSGGPIVLPPWRDRTGGPIIEPPSEV